MGLSATSVSAPSQPVDSVAIIAPAADVAAPSEFAAILRCYIPEQECEKTAGRFTRLNMALRAGPPYQDAEGARSWWAW
ncbi:hypothetical protein DVA67_007770 [Solirubrobacter sp. CPCC 204708]|nr:hypothetical protein [Solirubrobacter deserti]